MKLLIILGLLAVTIAEDNQNATKLLQDGIAILRKNLFETVVKSNPNSSVVMSAYSLITPLAQLSLAAEGVTQKEILKALLLPNIDVLKKSIKGATQKLLSVQGIELKMASKIYVATNKTVKSEFNAVSENLFNSKIENVDFAKAEETASNINKWVADQTNNHIKKMISPNDVDPKTDAIILNTLFFKGKWDNQFHPKLTSNQKFYVSANKTIDVPMMSGHSNYLYAFNENLNSQVIKVPYENKEAAFVIILPKEKDGISDLVEKLNDPKLFPKKSDLSMQNIDLKLPKFKIETKIDLRKILSKIGIKKVFEPLGAQLSNLVKNDTLFISKAIQKAFIEINEKGTEAGVANEFEVMVGSSLVDKTVEVIADHPFVYAIIVKDDIILSGVMRK